MTGALASLAFGLWASSHAPTDAASIASRWNAPGALSVWDLLAISQLLIAGVLYLRGVMRLHRRGAALPPRDRFAFACGWFALMLAVLPPIDSAAIELFSIHMVQHELMMLIGAPLVVVGRPLPTMLHGMPERWRPIASATLQSPGAGSAWCVLTTPAVAWTLHGAAIWIWHVPALYDLAVGNEGIHALEHATFIATSALFWWGLLYGRYGRLGYGAAVFYVFTTAVHTGLLGAAMTFASAPLYPVYVASAAARGGDALADQQIAGLVMWIPAGIVLTLLGLALFAAWLGESERRQRAHDVERHRA